MPARIVADSSAAELEKLRSVRAQVCCLEAWAASVVQTGFTVSLFLLLFFGLSSETRFAAVRSLRPAAAAPRTAALIAEINEKCEAAQTSTHVYFVLNCFCRTLDVDAAAMDAQR